MQRIVFLVFLMEISGRLAFGEWQQKKSQQKRRRGQQEHIMKRMLLQCFWKQSMQRKKVSLKEAFHWCPEYLQGLRVKEVELSPGLYLTEEDPGDLQEKEPTDSFGFV